MSYKKELQIKRDTKKSFEMIIINNIVIDPSKIITISTSSNHTIIKKEDTSVIKRNKLSKFILNNPRIKPTKSNSSRQTIEIHAFHGKEEVKDKVERNNMKKVRKTKEVFAMNSMMLLNRHSLNPGKEMYSSFLDKTNTIKLKPSLSKQKIGKSLFTDREKETPVLERNLKATKSLFKRHAKNIGLSGKQLKLAFQKGHSSCRSTLQITQKAADEEDLVLVPDDLIFNCHSDRRE